MDLDNEELKATKNREKAALSQKRLCDKAA